MRTRPKLWLLAPAACQPPGALPAIRPAVIAAANVSRASAVIRLALLGTSSLLAIAWPAADESTYASSALRGACPCRSQRHRERRALAGVVGGVAHRDRVREIDAQAAVDAAALGRDVPARATVVLR